MMTCIDALEKKLHGLIKEAKKRKKKAKKTKHERYFEGQQDAFEQILIELKNLRYELESHEGNEEESLDEKFVETLPGIDDTEALLDLALSHDVIIRKTSFYFYDDFPDGKVQGKKNALNLLKDETIAATVKQQIAETVAPPVEDNENDAETL